MKCVVESREDRNSSLVPPCAAEELALSLSEALSSGDGEEAVRLCQRLSQLRLPVSVTISSQAYPQDSIRWVGGGGSSCG